MPSSQYLLTFSSCTLGFAFAWIAWILTHVILVRRTEPRERYEAQRQLKLRQSSGVYRWFEPIVADLRNQFSKPQLDSPLAIALENSRKWSGWTAPEFYATKWLEGLLVALTTFGLVAAITGLISLALGLMLLLALGYPWLATRSVINNYQRHVRVLRARLPMVVDQLALMIEAGSNFEESLRTIVNEDVSHPLNIELSKVANEIDAGRSRRAALVELNDRLSDPDIKELVYAITKGEELGTPLSSILSGQAEQMRLKRAQWGEKAAAEAEVQIVFPGMLVMIACLIVVIAPILLPAIFNVLE